MRETTFGFEAEFQENASAVLAALHDQGLAGDRALHSYHCSCPDACEFGTYPFRGQTDSSCSGEIISDVLETGDVDHNVGLMQALSDAAVEVDGIPGMTSGFHVHVARPMDPYRSFWQFVLWEPTLVALASGRWSNQRADVNYPVRRTVTNYYGLRSNASTARFLELVEEYRGDPLRVAQVTHDAHHQEDRHSNLNLRTSHRTWEFRLWNSTRAPWRMRMFCELSVAFTDEEFIDALESVTPSDDRMANIPKVRTALRQAGYRKTAALVQRQMTYLKDKAAAAPASLTICT